MDWNASSPVESGRVPTVSRILLFLDVGCVHPGSLQMQYVACECLWGLYKLVALSSLDVGET